MQSVKLNGEFITLREHGYKKGTVLLDKVVTVYGTGTTMAKSGWGNTNLISPDPYVARTGYGKVHNPNNPLSTDQ